MSTTLKEMAALRDHSKDIFKDEGGKMKRELFINPHFLEGVLSCFHPYFARLKPLVREWWRILVCTYNTYNNVTQAIIHDHILGLLNKHLELIEAGEGDMKPTEAETSWDAKMLEMEELKRRKEDLRTRWRNWNAGRRISVRSTSPRGRRENKMNRPTASKTPVDEEA